MKSYVKYVLFVVATILLVTCMTSCSENTSTSSTSSTSSSVSSASSAGNKRDKMSSEEIYRKIESAAINFAFEHISTYSSKAYKNNTRYKITSVTPLKDPYEYEVCGIIYFYDKYDQLLGKATFEFTDIWIDENGYACSVGGFSYK